VHKNIGAIVTANKAETFRVIEPLHGSFHFHFRLPPGRALQHLLKGASVNYV
jgi:hypothetical protein